MRMYKTCARPSFCPWWTMKVVLQQRVTKNSILLPWKPQKAHARHAYDVKNVTGYKYQAPPLPVHSWICSEVSNVERNTASFGTKTTAQLFILIIFHHNIAILRLRCVWTHEENKWMYLKCIFRFVCSFFPLQVFWRKSGRRGLWTFIQKKTVFFLQVMDIWLLFLPPVCSRRKS